MMRNATLYLSRNGMLEPLGQSQVLSYLRGLAQDHRITLVSFERQHNLADAVALAQVGDRGASSCWQRQNRQHPSLHDDQMISFST